MSQGRDLICDCSAIIGGIIAFRIYNRDLKHSFLVAYSLGSGQANFLRGPSKVKKIFKKMVQKKKNAIKIDEFRTLYVKLTHSCPAQESALFCIYMSIMIIGI